MKQKEFVEAPFDVETRNGTAGIGMRWICWSVRTRTATSSSLGSNWDAQPGTTGGCAILPPLVGKRTGGAVWPWTEDTHRCGSFNPRSDVESEPEREEF